MKRSRLAFLALAAIGCASARTPTTAPQLDPSRWKTQVDFTELRATYGEREDFDAVCRRNRPLREMLEEVEERDWPTALLLSEAWLHSCPVDMDAHYLAAVALTELGREDEARAHVDWYRGLVESVLATGDGHSPETAWVVISEQEEYSILQALQVDLLGRSALDGGVHALAVEVEGEPRTFYFRPATRSGSPRGEGR